jgi:hypothetical protein
MAGMATVVAFHAHPDDEVLLTGGTLARLAAEGHRTWFAEPGARTVRPIGDVLQPAAPATGPAQGTVRR